MQEYAVIINKNIKSLDNTKSIPFQTFIYMNYFIFYFCLNKMKNVNYHEYIKFLLLIKLI